MKKEEGILTNIGIVLAFAGLSCMAMVKGLIGSNLQILSIGVVIVSIVFLLKGVNLRYLKTPTRGVALIFVYSIVTLIMCMLSGIDFMQSGYGFIYQATYFIEIYLVWNIKEEIDIDKYVTIAFWVCGFFCIVALYLLKNNTDGLLFFNNYTTSNGDYLFDREATGTISFLTFAMALANKPKSKVGKLGKTVFILVSVIVIVISSRRSVYIAVFVSLAIYLRNQSGIDWKTDKAKIIKGLCLFVLLVCVFFIVTKTNPNVINTLEHAWKLLKNGIRTLAGIDNSDQSAAIRSSAVGVAMDKYWNDTSIIQFVFGSGYMNSWVDIPLLQAFIDIGLLGGSCFFIAQFVIPSTHIIKRTESSAIMAAQYLTVLSMVEGVANSFPYGHFFSIVLLLTLDEKQEKLDQHIC